MTEEELNNYIEKLDKDLLFASKRFFRRQAMLDRDVVIVDDDGKPITMSAKHYLELYPKMRMTEEDLEREKTLPQRWLE